MPADIADALIGVQNEKQATKFLVMAIPVSANHNTSTNIRIGHIDHAIGSHKRMIRNSNFIQWKLDTFLSDLKRHDLAVMVHANNESGRRKSNNRLLVCMAIGLPSIVSDTPSYADTVTNAGFGNLICRDVSQINTIIRDLSSVSLRKEISERFVKYAWEHFSPLSVSLRLLDVFNSVRA